MRCPGCGHDNPDGQKFCGECGIRLVGAVGGAPAPPLAQAPERYASPAAYTPPHLADKILVSRAAVEGERKQVTVMFCDVAGYTSLSEGLDPEEVHGIMDRAFEVILASVHRYEGTINQFLGDGAMALFGAPIAHEDHAHRALRAALDFRRGLEPLRRDVQRARGRDFQMRIGLNTGLVVVGAIGRDLRMDYTAIGDTTNLAARLMALAQPGQIVVSRYTQHLRDDFFVFEDLGEFSVKGKTHPVRAFALHGEIEGQTRLEVSKARGLTPLSGRGAELGRLQRLHESVVSGRGAVVLLEGQPGAGKSRLLYEFVNATRPPVVLETTCVSHGRSMPFHPVVELLRRLLGVTDATPAADVRRRIDAGLDRLAEGGEEPVTVLAHFLGLEVSTEWFRRQSATALKTRTLELVRRFLLAAATDGGVVIFENAHWIDASSEEFLRALAAEVPSHRVLLIVTVRPGPDALVLPDLADRIALEGLDAEDLAAMVVTLAGAQAAHRDLLEMIAAKAAGNPLYVEEIMHQLRETDGLVVVNREARLTTTDVRVPATIHDIIAARVDRLPEALKQTLQAAAVVGRQFPVPLLAHVLGVEGALVNQLDQLHALDFLFPAPTAGGPSTYAFKHAVTQDVVYGSLLERRRRAYHTATATGMEAMYADRLDEVVELLSHHFDRGGQADKAVDYAILAGEKAQRRWANHEAVAHFDAALARLASLPDTPENRLRRIDAVVKQAEVKFALGRHAEHITALEAIHPLVDSAADPARRAAWYYWAGFLHSLTGSPPSVPMTYCRTAAAIADEARLEELGAFVQCCLAHVAVVAGELPAALGAGARALPVFEQLGNRWWACRTLWVLSMTCNAMGQWAQSLSHCARALEYGRAMGDQRLIVVGTWRIGSTLIQRGDPVSGLGRCDEALSLAPPMPFDEAMIRAVRGLGLVKVGELVAGVNALEQSVAWFERSNLRYTRSVVALWLADALLRAGDRLRAGELAESVLGVSRSLGYRHLDGIALRVLGQAVLPAAPAEAARLTAEAAQICGAIGARNDLARALVAQAEVARHTGDAEEAARLLDRAVEVFDELGTLDELTAARAARAALG